MPPRSALLLVTAASLPLALLARGALARFVITNRSMLPTLHPGDRLLVNTRAFCLHRPRRGDLVLVRHPDRPDLLLVKRIVGLPAEQVTLDTTLWIDGRPTPEPYLLAPSHPSLAAGWRLGPDQYLLLGDNRADSRDGRHFGPVRASALVGRAWYRYWPPERRGHLAGRPIRPIH